MSDDILEIIDHRRSSQAKLVRIKDGPQPPWCMSCGSEGEILFWSGKVTSCIPCAKGANVARKFGANIYQPGMSYKEFKAKLSGEIERHAKLGALEGDGLTYNQLKRYIKLHNLTLNEAINELYAARIKRIGGTG